MQTTKRIHIFYTALFLIVGICFFSFHFLDQQLVLFFEKIPRNINLFFQWVSVYGKAKFFLYPSAIVFFISLFFLKIKSQIKPRHELAQTARNSLFLFVSVAASGLVTDILKFALGRFRPIVWLENGYYGLAFFEHEFHATSFPSGHASNTVSFLAAAFLLTKPRYRPWLIPLFIFTIIIILSRLFINAHYFSDVLFGIFVACATTITLHKYFFKKSAGLLFKMGIHEGPRPGIRVDEIK